MTRSAGPMHVAPRALDPVLRLAERLDRWRRHIRPLSPGSLLGREDGRYRGPTLDLPGGERLEAGARVWILHFDNARLRELVSADAWPTRGYAAARGELAILAAQVGVEPAARRPIALGGVTVLAALSRRLGFTLFERPRSPRVALEDWYLRSLLGRWAPTGRRRLARGHGGLRTRAAWISAAELLRRYGPPPE